MTPQCRTEQVDREMKDIHALIQAAGDVRVDLVAILVDGRFSF